ncbi:uncharacterized protein LOC106459982 isoform X2 [Limulus polyphemus]|uniref:Uncharacterized protein LOC106459982 isoform X2 n=1 Tax=Limulus polyphemus TaxID=6850 RepID=A0ABM1B5B3_LIMPO|nr:uncharacterized protein LOC106459982 isoform X2 [Limulus polyphemus]
MDEQLQEKVVRPYIDFQPDDRWHVKEDATNNPCDNMNLGGSTESNQNFPKESTLGKFPHVSLINGVPPDESKTSNNQSCDNTNIPVEERKENNNTNLECEWIGKVENQNTSCNSLQGLKNEQYSQKLSKVGDELNLVSDNDKTNCTILVSSEANEAKDIVKEENVHRTTENICKSLKNTNVDSEEHKLRQNPACPSNDVKNTTLSGKVDCESLVNDYLAKSEPSEEEHSNKGQSPAHEATPNSDIDKKITSPHDGNFSKDSTQETDELLKPSDSSSEESKNVEQKSPECEKKTGDNQEKDGGDNYELKKNLESIEVNKDERDIREMNQKNFSSSLKHGESVDSLKLEEHCDHTSTVVEKAKKEEPQDEQCINENKESGFEELIKTPKGLVVKPVDVEANNLSLSKNSSQLFKNQTSQYEKAGGKSQNRKSNEPEASTFPVKTHSKSNGFESSSTRVKQKNKIEKRNESITDIPDILKSGLLKDLTISIVPSSKNELHKSVLAKPIQEKSRDKPKEKPKEKPPEIPQDKYKEQPLPPLLETICGSVVTDEMVEKILQEAKFPDILKGEVNIGKFIPVKLPDSYNFRLCEDEALLECPSMVTPLLLKKKDKFPSKVTLQDESKLNKDVKNDDGLSVVSEKLEDRTKKNEELKDSDKVFVKCPEFNEESQNKIEKVEENAKDKNEGTKDVKDKCVKSSVDSAKLKSEDLEDDPKDKEISKFTVDKSSENKTENTEEERKETEKISDCQKKAENTTESMDKVTKETNVCHKSSDENQTEKSLKDTKKTTETCSGNENKLQEENKELFTSNVLGFLTAIGLSRVQEWYQKDLVKSKERHIRKEGKKQQLENELLIRKMDYLQTKKANEPFVFQNYKCNFCEFKSESSIVFDGHSVIPYVTARREFGCHFCEFCTRDPKAIIFHMEAEHGKMGQLPIPSHFHECPFCPFDTNQKQKLNSHMNRCQKFFVLGRNQVTELDMPAQTSKPITIMDIKAYLYDRQLAEVAAATARRPGRPSRGSHRNNASAQKHQASVPRPLAPASMLPYNQSLYHHLSDNTAVQPRPQIRAFRRAPGSVSNNRIHHPTTNAHMTPPSTQVPLTVPTNQIYQVVRGGKVLPVFSTSNSATSCRPVTKISNVCDDSGPQPVALFTNVASSGGGTHIVTNSTKSLLKTGMPPPPRLQGPFLPSSGKSAPGETILPSNSFVICEICDGYIKDQEQLRNHMQLIHKVKIHPKMLQNRPPLNCQKCQWRFFTDQGLERHLLGSHGLVTSNMQELAQKNQDAGRCTICGRVYVCKLVAHMNQVHKITLKPAHLSYKCTVCTATFNLYKLFENHVYVVHSGSVKRHADDVSSNQPAKKFAGDSSTKTGTLKATPRSKSRKPATPMRIGAGSGKTRDGASVVAEEKTPNEDGHAKQKCGDCGIETLGCRRSPRRRSKPAE